MAPETYGVISLFSALLALGLVLLIAAAYVLSERFDVGRAAVFESR